MELVMEAAKEHEAELLNYLPEEFITSEVVEEIFAGEMSSYYWKCDLSLIPVECRTEEICLKALKCSSDNILHVPAKIINSEMVEKILSSPNRLQFLPLIPSHFWTKEFVYRVMKSFSRYLKDSSVINLIRKCQVILSLMPETLNTCSFYHGLFGEDMASAVIAAITPKKYRNKEYYSLMAAYDVEQVPNAKLDLELIHVMLGKDARSCVSDIFKNKDRKEIIFGMMDNNIADILVAKKPAFFSDLPAKFQTSTRLALAIRSAGEQGTYSRYNFHYNDKLLTFKVVKEFIRQGIECKIPEKFWNEDLVAFCSQHNKSAFWFTQIPKELQTKESTTVAIRYSSWNLQHALKKNITREVATEIVRSAVDDSSFRSGRNDLEYLPAEYFTEFKKKTGLPEKFLGGEVGYKSLKDERKSFTYCRIGNIYAGIFMEGYRSSPEYYLIITRVDKRQSPRTLFEGRVWAFHKTWLEKPIAEHDGKFVKPSVDPSLKDVQGVSYYGVELIEHRDGFDIYANTFCGITVGYCVKKDGLTYHDDSIETALAGWEEKVEQARLAEEERNNPESAEPDPDSVVFTAEILHRKYHFCETGMTAFVNDYGLDYNGRYSVGYLRQVVALQGPKPSLRSYGRELRQIRVIQ
jgi:hypothetical protein